MQDNFEAKYISNMTFMQKRYNRLYENIINTDISHLGIHPTSFGINIDSNGEMVYPQNVDAAIDNQVDKFLAKPTSISKKACIHRQEIGTELHYKLLREIEKFSPRHENTFQEYSLNPNLNTLPFLIITGIGSGKHIERLLEKTDIKHLIIIDKDFTFLKLSMHITNWEKIISSFDHPSYTLDFFITDDPCDLAYYTINEIALISPYKAYYIPYYTHYNSPFFDEVKKHFLDKFQLLFQGLGFIDDELNSLRKTLKNLDHNIPVYMGTNDIPKNSTLFIVASGPSLDNDIEYIKKHKDDVVIFSCGTALRILEKNGITPDFHFEIEREEEIHDVLQQYTSKHIRDKVALVGLNVLYDKVFTEDFKESYLYFRGSDAGASIVPMDIPKLSHPNPTVTNGAISFASEFSWDKIYLFGADMGFKDKDKHHSKDAFQYTPNEKDINWHTLPGRTITNHLEANFGGDKVYCTSVFFWTKQNIENLLITKDITIFNCSDGVKIEKTIPFHAKDIVIEKIKKKKAIKAIKKNFEDLKTDEPTFRENYKVQVDIFYRIIDNIKAEISKKDIKSFADIFLILDNSFDIFRQMEVILDKEYKTKKLLGTTLIRGTITSAYSTIYTHTLSTYNLQKAIIFTNKAFDITYKYLEDLKNEIYRMY